MNRKQREYEDDRSHLSHVSSVPPVPSHLTVPASCHSAEPDGVKVK